MLGAQEKVTLFGRFRTAARPEIERLLAERGAQTVRDLTRQTTLLVVGAGSVNLISSGTLAARLAEARARGVAVTGEARFLAMFAGDAPPAPTLPVGQVAEVDPMLLDILNAFDLIALSDGKVRFEDADTLRNAAALAASGVEDAKIVQSLTLRRTAPRGRHRLGLNAAGETVLEWEDGTTTLSGQFMLPLEDGDSVDAIFEDALQAEMTGDLDTAIRLYETCARADRKDPIAPYNLGNALTAKGDLRGAKLAFERALTRDPRFAEAHFNLAGGLERLDDVDGAVRHLRAAIAADDDFLDPLFNLAQLERNAGRLSSAADLYRRYLFKAGRTPLAEKARQALKLIAHERSR